MKNLIVLVAGLAFLVMCACTQKVDLEAEKAQVKTVVNELEQFLETEDMELFSKIMAHDTGMVNFGTDATERIVGWEPLKEMMQKQNTSYENAKITVKDQVINVNKSGNTAWFSEVVDWDLVAQGQPFNLPGSRFTGVLEKRNGDWVIVQFHASIPVSGQAAPY